MIQLIINENQMTICILFQSLPHSFNLAVNYASVVPYLETTHSKVVLLPSASLSPFGMFQNVQVILKINVIYLFKFSHASQTFYLHGYMRCKHDIFIQLVRRSLRVPHQQTRGFMKILPHTEKMKSRLPVDQTFGFRLHFFSDFSR